jgi:hypothetical protein
MKQPEQTCPGNRYAGDAEARRTLADLIERRIALAQLRGFGLGFGNF